MKLRLLRDWDIRLPSISSYLSILCITKFRQPILYPFPKGAAVSSSGHTSSVLIEFLRSSFDAMSTISIPHQTPFELIRIFTVWRQSPLLPIRAINKGGKWRAGLQVQILTFIARGAGWRHERNYVRLSLRTKLTDIRNMFLIENIN